MALTKAQSPFLLFRSAVSEGSPRSIRFSTLVMAVERGSFGNDDNKTSMAIARFMDTCRITGYSQYHPDDQRTTIGIEHAVAHVGISALESIRFFRPPSKNDIKNMTQDCQVELGAYFDVLMEAQVE